MIRRVMFTYFFVSASFLFLNGQRAFIDSLLILIEDDIPDSVRMGALFDLSEAYYQYYGDSIELALHYNDELLSTARKVKSQRWIVSHYNMKGRILQYQKQFEDAIVSYDEGVRFAFDMGDSMRAAQIMDNKAGIYASQRRFDEALSIQNKSLDIFKKNNDSLSLGICHFGIGYTYLEKYEYQPAKVQFKRSLDYFVKNDGARAEIYGNLAKVYRGLDQIDSSMICFELAANYAKNYPFVLSKNLYELSNLYFRQEQYEKADSLLNELFKISNNDPNVIEYTYYRILHGRIAIVQGESNEAKTIWSQIKAAMDSTEVGLYKLDFNRFSYELFESQGEYKEAIDYLKRYHEINEKLQSDEREVAFEDIEIKYQTREKEQEINLLNTQNELQNSQLLVSRNRTIGLSIGLLLFAGLITWLYRLNQIVKKSVDEKDTLLREIHHRVKNNLQVISALLTLQSSHLNDAQAKSALQEGQDRVQSMALIHKDLYQHDNLKGVNTKDYLEQLIENLLRSYKIDESEVQLNLDIAEINLDVDTMIPMGLMVNELISNALKHAFNQSKDAILEIKLSEQNDQLLMTIADNGKGVADIDGMKKKSFGYSLVQSFARKLDAALQIESREGLQIDLTIKNYKKV